MEVVNDRPYAKLSIRDWAQEDRPRERLLTQGPKALSDAELVAILIRSGTPQDTALELAQLILHQAGNDLNRLGRVSAAELMKLRGMGEAKALSIVAALELGMRRRDSGVEARPRISTSTHVHELMRPVLADLHHEEFWLVLLDRGMRLLGKHRVSQGGMHGTVADPKLIFREALERRASCLVLCHNHPSGQLRPSEEDRQLTHKLAAGGRLLDILVQDHVIITNAGYYSFADNGQL
ncbi:MAG: DNA repair protein RadC [Bacteroidetes bacterium]|nr:DNA repair protein RadC [Bacteroidota bacterium]